MIDIQQLWERAGREAPAEKKVEFFAALYREALIAELVAGSGEPVIGLSTNDGMDFYTSDQLAGAIMRERDRCAKVCEPTYKRPCDCDHCECGNSGDRAEVVAWDESMALAAAIRSGA